MNLKGFVEALIKNIGFLSGLDNPQYKITPAGFLQMLLENPTMAKISNAKQILNGAERELKVRYVQRGLESDVSDSDDCDTPLGLTFKETTIGRPLFSKIGIYISDEDMRKYDNEAQKTLAVGTPSAPMMVALYEALLTKINGLVQKINANLLSTQAAKWGTNAVTGSNSPLNVRLSPGGMRISPIVTLLEHYQLNEGVESPVIVGNGGINRIKLVDQFQKAPDSLGNKEYMPLKVYHDIRSTTAWGQNHFGLFTPGMVGFVDFNRNVKPYAGLRGGSYFFTLPVPVQLADGKYKNLVFDCQLKYQDCPVEKDDAIIPRGWHLIVSKSYGLYNAPADIFAEEDRLHGVNGSFHYVGS